MKRTLPLAVVAAAVLPVALGAQTVRDGLWVEMGAGGGWNLVRGLESGGFPRSAGHLRVGATPGERFRIGMEAIGWWRSSDVADELQNHVFSALNVGVVSVFYPLVDRPWYLNAGLGYATSDVSVVVGDDVLRLPSRTRHGGIGVTLGAGMEAPLVANRLHFTIGATWGGQFYAWQAHQLQRLRDYNYLVVTAGLRVGLTQRVTSP